MNFFIGEFFSGGEVISINNSNDHRFKVNGINACNISEIHRFVFLGEKINTLEEFFPFFMVILSNIINTAEGFDSLNGLKLMAISPSPLQTSLH